MAKGCHYYLITKTFWDYSYKISQHEKKSFLYYLIQVQVHVYSNHWNIFNQIFNNPPSPTIAPPQKHYHLKLYEEFSLIYTLYREKMMYVNNIRDKMPLVHCTASCNVSFERNQIFQERSLTVLKFTFNKLIVNSSIILYKIYKITGHLLTMWFLRSKITYFAFSLPVHKKPPKLNLNKY